MRLFYDTPRAKQARNTSTGKILFEISLGKPRAIWDALRLANCIGKTPFSHFTLHTFHHMPIWEYKVITSGVHGFATPALLESYLNNLGKDEWEIVNYLPSPANPLAFTGLVRRPTQRDWTPPAALVSAPPAVELKPQSPAPGSAKTETPKDAAAETSAVAPSDSETSILKSETTAPAAASTLRPVRDTERDLDPDAEDDEDDDADEWDNLDLDDDLPTFFDALKPHMRNNQKGPGQSVAVDYLSKRWELREVEILGALKECGLTIPETEDAEPEYFEFEDDLFWVNRNNRGQYFINTREKPRPVFRTVAATPLSPDDPAYAELAAERAEEKTRIEKRNAERAAQQAAAAARAEEAAKRRAEAQAAKDSATPESGAEQPAAGDAAQSEPDSAPPDAASDKPLLDRIRPMMRRNRHGPGYSGSIGFLARALKTTDADLAAQLTALGLHIPAASNEKPTFVEIGAMLYWLNKDNRGNIWINARENKNGAKKPAGQPPAISEPSAAPEEKPGAQQEQLDLPPVEAADASAPAAATEPAPEPVPTAGASPLAAVRPLLKPNKRGSGVSGEVGYLARALEQNETEFVAALTNAGLVVPPGADTKPTFVEHEGEIFWFSFYEKDGVTSVWLNAKPSRKSKAGGKTTRAPRTRKPKADSGE